ncbi:hypothetical protein WME94_30440 [Sorangium sp. So ce429]
MQRVAGANSVELRAFPEQRVAADGCFLAFPTGGHMALLNLRDVSLTIGLAAFFGSAFIGVTQWLMEVLGE